jgi:hypothetical protein
VVVVVFILAGLVDFNALTCPFMFTKQVACMLIRAVRLRHLCSSFNAQSFFPTRNSSDHEGHES